MALKIEKGGWLVIGLIGVGLVGYSLKKYGILDKIAPSAKVQESIVPKRVDLPALNPSLASNVAAAPLPGGSPGCTDKPEVRIGLIGVGLVGYSLKKYGILDKIAVLLQA